MKFRVLFLFIVTLVYTSFAFADVYELSAPKGREYFLVLPKGSKPKAITVNGNALLKNGVPYFDKLSSHILIAKFTYPIPAIYLTNGVQRVEVDWGDDGVPEHQVEIKTDLRNQFIDFRIYIPSLFSLLLVLVIFFIKKDFEDDKSFNFAMLTGLNLAVYLYFNSSHPYVAFPGCTGLVLKLHILFSSLVSFTMIGLTDRFFKIFRRKTYLYTPLLTLVLICVIPGWRSVDNFNEIVLAIVPNAIISCILIAVIVYRLLFVERFKSDITYIPVLITGAVSTVVSAIDTYVTGYDAFTEPPISGYGIFLFYVTLILSNIVKNKKMRISNLAVHERVAAISNQVAHDIRSPLAALQVQLTSLSGLSSEKQTLLRESAARINDILNDLQGTTKTTELAPVSVNHVVDQLIAEKRIEHKDAKIVNATESKNQYMIAGEHKSTLQRVLSNLINNSIEAKNEAAPFVRVMIDLDASGMVKVSIIDNGKGIPDKLISQIVEKNFSYQKENGQGLGLSYVDEKVKLWGGKLHIESIENEYTTVTLTIPKIEIGDYVLIDNEELMILGWTIQGLEKGVKFKGFKSFHEFEKAYNEDSSQFSAKTIFYVDYELGGATSGFDIAKKLSELGFTEINIFSGRMNLDISAYSYIKKCVAKDYKLF